MMCKRFDHLSWIFLFMTGFWLIPGTALANNPPKKEFVRTINREFSTLANGMTALYNKYGKVNVNTWNNNSVKIDITIVVNATDQRSADKAFDRIKINFTHTPGYVKAETFLTDNANETGWWPGSGVNFQDFKINYEIWMPVGNQLDLKNKYGNSYVGPMNNKIMADIRYGDLRTEAIVGDADLYVGYGKAYMAAVKNVSGQISYGEFNAVKTGDVQLETKYSDLQIDNGQNLRITSKYDDFKFGTIGDLRLQTKYSTVQVNIARSSLITSQYTDVRILSLSEKVDADLSFGSLQIDELVKNFDEANVVGKHATVKLVTARGTNFRFESEGSYMDLKYPTNATLKYKDASTSWKQAKGFVGDSNAHSFVRVKMDHSNVILK